MSIGRSNLEEGKYEGSSHAIMGVVGDKRDTLTEIIDQLKITRAHSELTESQIDLIGTLIPEMQDQITELWDICFDKNNSVIHTPHEDLRTIIQKTREFEETIGLRLKDAGIQIHAPSETKPKLPPIEKWSL